MVLRRYIEEPGETCVVIPEGVTIIGDGAFRGCDKIQEVVIPEGVTKIGERVFAGCNSLQTIGGKNWTTNTMVRGGILILGSSYVLEHDGFTFQFDLSRCSEADRLSFVLYASKEELQHKEAVFTAIIKSPEMKQQLACFLAIGYDSEVGKTYLKRNIKKVMAMLTDRNDIDTISEVLKLGYVTMKNFDDIFDYVNAKKGGEFTELKVILLNYKHDHIGYQTAAERFKL